MNFNPSKCHIMQIARAKPMMKLYEMCGVILASVDRAKYLGVTVSKNLQWHDQVGTVTKKANSTLHMVARNLRYCPRKSRTLAYCSLVRPKLEYCASVSHHENFRCIAGRRTCNILDIAGPPMISLVRTKK